MRRLIITIILITILTTSVSAMDFTAPNVPDSGSELMPESYDTFAEGLWFVIRSALGKIAPNLQAACKTSLSVIAVVVLTSFVSGFSFGQSSIISLVRALMIGILLLQQSNTFVGLSRQVIEEISNYGKLLLPVMAASLAAQGGVTGATGIYAGTVLFDTVLTAAISKLLIPLIFIYLALSIAGAALGTEAINELKGTVKWLMTWLLKIILYVFTGYITITGVISGTADAAAIKAAKLTISGFVPVIGNIISDASEAILISAGVMKSAAGVYGLIAVAAVCLGPFLQIGTQYLLLKGTAAICGVISGKKESGLIKDFSVVMGILLAMIGSISIMLFISIVCFMKGVG